MIDELDNAAVHWLTALTTRDGTGLTGFASAHDALAYDYNAPLRWFPHEIDVTETTDASGFPRPTNFATHGDGRSQLMDLLGLLGGYAQLYALTDHANPDAGGSQPAQAYFDGDPFVNDDPLVDGDASCTIIHSRCSRSRSSRSTACT